MKKQKTLSRCVDGRPHDYAWILLAEYRGRVASEREYLEKHPWREGDAPATFMMVCDNKGCAKTFGVATATYRRRKAEELTREMVARNRTRS